MPKAKAKKYVDQDPPFKSVYEGRDSKSMTDALSYSECNKVVELHIRLITKFDSSKFGKWKAMNSSEWVRSDTRLGTIRRKIAERHGRIANLAIYGPDKKNELLDDDKTLENLGIPGGTKSEGLEGVLYYDFSPDFYCPLLLTEPNLRIPQGYNPDLLSGVMQED